MGPPQLGQRSLTIFFARATCSSPLCFSMVQFLRYPFFSERKIRFIFFSSLALLYEGIFSAPTNGVFTLARKRAIRSAIFTYPIFLILLIAMGISPTMMKKSASSE